MKELFLKKAVIVLFIIINMFSFIKSVHAVDINIGGITSYSWWNAAWNNKEIPYYELLKNINSPGSQNYYRSKFKSSPIFSFGPLLSVRFSRSWGISSLFIYDRFNFDLANSEIIKSRSKFSMNIKKYDSTININYYITDYFRLLGGCTVIINKYDIVGYNFSSNVEKTKLKGQLLSYGPCSGFGFDIHLFHNFYFLSEFTALLLWNREEMKNKFQLYGGVMNTKGNFYCYGGIISASFAYEIDSINTILNLGFKYQMLHCIQNKMKTTIIVYNGMNDYLYRIYFSATYTFSIGEKIIKKKKTKKIWIPEPNKLD